MKMLATPMTSPSSVGECVDHCPANAHDEITEVEEKRETHLMTPAAVGLPTPSQALIYAHMHMRPHEVK